MTPNYPATPCGGNSAGTTLPCPAGCPAGTYNAAPTVGCTTAHFFTCLPCSYNAPPGYWYSTAAATNCTTYQDVMPTACSSGFYCPGGSSQPIACPAGLVSSLGASTVGSCFCPAGLALTQLPSGQPSCAPVVCPGLQQLFQKLHNTPSISTPAAPRRSAPRICAKAPLSCPNVPPLLSHVML